MADISEILKDARVKRGFSVDELSDRTKIRKSIIENIENSNFDDFQEVYLKAFIRSLAKELKIIETPEFIDAYKDITKILSAKKSIHLEPTNDYKNTDNIKSTTNVKLNKEKKETENKPPKRNISLIVDDVSSTETKPEVIVPQLNSIVYSPKPETTKLFRRKPKFSTNFWIYTAIIVFVAIVLFITFYPMTKDTTITPVKLDTSQSTSTVDIKSSTGTNENIMQYFKTNDSLILKAEPSDTVWVSIIIDKTKKSPISILMPNQTYQWSAAEEFKISHGNAGKLKLYLNDKPLAPFAPPGYIAKDVIITKEGVKNPNQQRIDSIRTQRKMKAKEKNKQSEFRPIEPSSIEDLNKH
jgi:transcriptional regulator with XRE-family HTH domain